MYDDTDAADTDKDDETSSILSFIKGAIVTVVVVIAVVSFFTAHGHGSPLPTGW